VKKFESGTALKKFQYTMYDNLKQCTPRAVANWAYAFAFAKPEYKPKPRKLDFKREEWAEWSDGVWNINFQGTGLDISGGATYPVEFAKRCIKIYTNPGDVVLDPFLGCYDEQTEVLTRTGWKFFRDVTWEDEIAYNGGILGLCYAKPTKILKIPYEGEMLHLKTNTVDLLVTPDHNIYAALRKYPLPKADWEYELHSARSLVGKYFILKRDVEWFGKEEEYFILPGVVYSEDYHPKKVPERKLRMDLWLEFFGWWLAEGYTSSGYVVGLRLGQSDDRERVKEVIRSLGFTLSNVSDETKLVIHDKQLWSYLSQFGKATEKYIPRELLELSRRQLRILLESYIRGDGNIDTYECYTSSVKLRDDLQELALKCGYAATYTLYRKAGYKRWTGKDREAIIYQHDAYIVQIIRGQLRPKVEYDKGWTSEYYKGYVYCVEVPTHTLYVRRNGKPIWCGNTGTTMLAAFELGRSCVGYEVLERMLPIIKTKVHFGQQDMFEPVQWEVVNKYE
jgi:hypothetical protein